MTPELPSLASLSLALPRVPVWVGVRTKPQARRRLPSPRRSRSRSPTLSHLPLPSRSRSRSPASSRSLSMSRSLSPRRKRHPEDAPPITVWMPPPPTPHAPCPDNPALVVRPSGIPNAGDGLFTTVDIPEFTIIAEYHGRVGTDADVIASRYQSTYAGALPSPAVPVDGGAVYGAPVTSVLGDVDNCIATKANMLPGAHKNNATLVSSTDPIIQSALGARYLEQRHALRAGGGRVYACDRIYVLAFHPISAGEEIFLNYGAAYEERLTSGS